MVIIVQKKGIRFPQSGWHIHRVILHLCIPGSPRRWSAIPEDSAMLRNSRSLIHSHGWISIYSNIDDGNSWRNDQHAFRKEWVRGSIPRFTRMHTLWSILFPLKIASLNGHFTVSQVEPGNIDRNRYLNGRLHKRPRISLRSSFTWE